MGDFVERMTALGHLVGRGRIEARVTVDQIYARRQHQDATLAHPGGGEAFYLKRALEATYREHLQRVAMQLFQGNVQQLFVRYAENLDSARKDRTPVELGNLRESGRAEVLVGGAFIYRRPAPVGRMSRKTLNARHRSRRR